VPWCQIFLYVLYGWLNSSAGIYALKNYLWLPVEQYAYKAISTAAYNHIMNLSSEFHDSKRSGELYQSINLGHSVNNLLETIMFQILPMLVDLAVAFAYLYYLFDAYMALIVGAVMVVYLWASTYFNAWQITVRRGLVGNLQKEWQIMYDSMGSWQTVSYFNRVKHEQDRYSSAVKVHLQSQRIYTALAYFARATQSSVLSAGLLGACFLAAYQVVHGAQSIGSFVVLLTYWAQLSGPLTFFGSAYRQISSDFLDAEQLLQLLQYRPSVADRTGARALVLKQGEVKFDNVHFSYDSQRQTLKGISFLAAPGQTVALVGETGGGKSTILKLLFRFYDVGEGTIKIDGQDIRHVTLESLRENIGVVPQDPSLFNETIMSNVRYARLDATDDEVYDACKAAAIHDKTMSFTDGYQSKVGERGVRLSGGELQRIAIARAILKNPNIILLDEATSSVDTETEIHIQEAFRRLTSGRTTFVVAHRLSTIMNADLILVVKNGEILEQGTHDELFHAKGKYHSLWSKQIFVGQSQGPSKSPEKGQETTIINDLSSQPKTQDLVEAVNSLPHQLCHGHAKPSSSHDREQENPEDPSIGLLGKETSVVSKENNGGKGKLLALRQKFWRPDAPEFVPQHLRTTSAKGGQPPHQHKVSSHDRSYGHSVDGHETLKILSEPSRKGKAAAAISKNDKNMQETLLFEVPPRAIDEQENSPASGRTEKEKKRRWRKRKSRDTEEPSQQPSVSVSQANLEEESAINRASQPEGNASPANNRVEEPKSKAKRPRLNRRAQSKSEPAGHGRSQTDGTSEIEPTSSGSTDDQPMSNITRRVSAPSDPPSGQTATKGSKYGRRRRRRHWRDRNGEASGTQSMQSTASWSTDSPRDGTGTPAAPVTSPATGVRAVNSSTRIPSGSGVRFAPGS